MNRIAIASLLALAAAGAHAETYVDNARVRSVEPQYESVNVPREACSAQLVTETRRVNDRNYGGVVAGGLVGALLGNQVGRGHGREAATALGAVAGAFAGDQMANGNRTEQYVEVPREVRTCQMVSEVQTRIVGYRVVYEFRGQEFATVLRDNPGPTLQVRVSVDPVVGFAR